MEERKKEMSGWEENLWEIKGERLMKGEEERNERA